MPIIYNKVQNLQERVDAALADDFKHNAIETAQNTFHAKRELLVEQLPMWEDYRDACKAIRDHVTENLDYYVREFVTNAEKSGYKVHFAPTDIDALHAILDIVEETGALSCVKSKSMMTEEIGVNDLFEDIGVKVIETDCAEAIIQTAEDKPSHIVVPALHFDRKAIAELFREKRGYTGTEVPEEITHFLRQILREEFLTADIGMRGSNFLVAETGSLTLVSNEGNGRMVDSIPEIQIAVCGIDRIVPDLATLDVMEQEHLVENAAFVGRYIINTLRDMRLPHIQDVRGEGLMIGIELDQPYKSIRERLLFEEHCFTGCSGTNVLRLLPPLCLSMDQAADFIEKFKRCINNNL